MITIFIVTTIIIKIVQPPKKDVIMKIQKEFLLYLLTSFSIFIITSSSKLPPTKELTIIAQRDFLHDYNSRCLLKLNPIGTIVTPNDMDDDGNILIDETRNSAIIHIAKPQKGIIRVTVNFENECFMTDYKIDYAQLTDKNNIIHLYENSITLKTSSKEKTLQGKKSYKSECFHNKRPENVNLTEARPGAVVAVQAPAKMTVEDILHKYHSKEHILKSLVEQGYHQSNLTQKNLELYGKLTPNQIEYIMTHLPLNGNVTL